MSIWAAIKYAINSTIGTADFMSLDELIKNQKTLYASDEYYAALYNTELKKTVDAYNVDNIEIPISITMRGNGSFKVAYKHCGNTASTNTRITVFKNGEKLIDTEYAAVTSVSTWTEVVSPDIIFEDGDTFSFEYWLSNTKNDISHDFKCKDLILKGTIKDNVFALKEV